MPLNGRIPLGNGDMTIVLNNNNNNGNRRPPRVPRLQVAAMCQGRPSGSNPSAASSPPVSGLGWQSPPPTPSLIFTPPTQSLVQGRPWAAGYCDPAAGMPTVHPWQPPPPV